MKHLGMTLMLVATLFIVTACDGSGGGICVADYATDQCYDCWDQDLCEESSERQWFDDFDSCEEAGYTHYIGNECGYTM